MKVKHLIRLLNKVKNKERNIQFLYGNDDEDLFASDVIHVLHALDDDEQCVELFVNEFYTYKINNKKLAN
tara:strand:+ start:2953 stop:3162 length:210 start_codon:yes stop_codon:yes gene_type:complete